MNLRLEELRVMPDMKEASDAALWRRRQELPRHLGREGYWVGWNDLLTKPDWKTEMQKRAKEYSVWEKKAFLEAQTINRRVNFGQQKHQNCVQCSNARSSFKYEDIICHKHFSSIKRRSLFGHINEEMKYECSSCEETEHFKCTADKIKIILTAEPLEGAKNRKLQEAKDKIHVDMTCLPDTDRFGLFHAFLADYAGIMKEKACDVLVLGFLPDLISGYSVGEIVKDARKFKSSVKAMNVGNTVAFCTNYLPPCCTILPGDPQRFNHRNLTNDIVFLNGQLMEMNEEDEGGFSRHAPRFHTWGLRTHANSEIEMTGWHRNVLETKGGHSYHQWWNAEPSARYLQLNMAAKVYKACVKFFEAMGKISEDPEGKDSGRKVVEMTAEDYEWFRTRDEALETMLELDNVSDCSIDREMSEFNDLAAEKNETPVKQPQATSSVTDSGLKEKLERFVDRSNLKKKAAEQLPILHKEVEKSQNKKARATETSMPPIQEGSEDNNENREESDLSFYEKLDKACEDLK